MDHELDRVAPDQDWHTVGVLDAAGCFEWVNGAVALDLGIEAQQLVGGCFAELLPLDDRVRFNALLSEMAGREGAGRRVLAFLTRCEGRSAALATRQWRLTGLRAASGRFGVALEVRPLDSGQSPAPRRERSDEVLQRKSAELEATLRALPDLFFRFDSDGHFLDYSAPSTSELYAPPEFFLGKHPRDVMPPELALAMEEARAKAHTSGALVTMEYELDVPGGRQQFEARYVPFVDRQTIAMVRNITERRQAELALSASEARLRESQKIEAVGRLAGGVAHDFNNLLMIILGYASSLARRFRKDHPAAIAVEEIRKAGERATALTKQLLALSRRQPMRPIELDLSEVLRDMDSMLTRVIGEHVRLRTEVAPELRAVLADRSQIEQVVLNLVLNARDALPRGGKIDVRAENAALGEDGAPRISDRAAATHVGLYVSDDGTGMDPNTRARIFEAFFTTKASGTGLGLFTVRNIVDEAGGVIRVTSELGSGTRIVVLLPAIDQAPKSKAAEVVGPMPGGRETVLVVEDEDAVRALVSDLLQSLGYTVFSAANASSVREQLSARPRVLDLLLTDIVMPGQSGWELASEIIRSYPECRVLYMSGHAIRFDDGEDLGTGYDILLKPFTPEVLAARVREALDHAGPKIP